MIMTFTPISTKMDSHSLNDFVLKLLLAFLFLLTMLAALPAQVIISEVFADGSFELRNTGNTTVDISGYFVCNAPDYRRLDTMKLECGDLNLEAGTEAVFVSSGLFEINDSELGLYSTNVGGFGNVDNIIAYVEWGSTGHTRSGIATNKGIWDGNAAPAFRDGESLNIDGDGFEAADWTVNLSPQICPTLPPPTATSSARYRVTFDALWSSQTHPTEFPNNPHFSGLIGLTHTDDVALFEAGTLASDGIVSMAETGSKSPLLTEIQAVIDSGQGETTLSGDGVGTSPGMVTLEFDISDSFSLVSLTTMIAPSPDWFVAVKDLNLLENGSWIDSITVVVGVYDAGSDSGASFESDDSPTDPRENISLITTAPLAVNGVVATMGTMTFERIDTTVACLVDGGVLSGPDFTFCVDGVRDTIPEGAIRVNGNSGTNQQWVVTDDQGTILGLPPSPSAPDFDAAGAGVCLVWNLAYEEGLTGLAVDSNVSQLIGCFDLSDSIIVTRNQPQGGTISGGPFSFCVDGVRDTIAAGSITLVGNTGTNNQWVVTDTAGTILGLPSMPSVVDFDAAGVGICFIWNLAYEDTLANLAMGNNVSQLEGCYDLSNSIMVSRTQPSGGTLTGGPFSFCVDGVRDTIAAGSITLAGNTGTNNQWIVTDTAGTILGLPSMPSVVDFDAAGAGICFIWNLAYEDTLANLAMGNNVSQLEGCYDLSNSIMVSRLQPNGGTLVGGPFTFCVGDGEADNIPVGSITLSGNEGTNNQWIVTDTAGTILGLPSMPSIVDFDESGIGRCLVWNIAYEDTLANLVVGGNTNLLEGCFNISNSVVVIRTECPTMCLADGGTITGGPFNFCVDGVRDTIAAGSITLTGNTGTNNQWVVTDTAGTILGLPSMPSVVDFDAAGVGVCFIWNLAYEDTLANLAMGNNVSQLEGCYDLSNSIMVNRAQPDGGVLTGGPFTFCVGDGEADNIPAGSITLSDEIGSNSQWLVTDSAGTILGLPDMPSVVDFDDAGAGTCLVWHISYEDGLTGLAVNNNVDQLVGCFDISNAVTVQRSTTEPVCTPSVDACAVPSDIQVDVLSATRVSIDWENIANAQRYLIEIRFAGASRVVGRGRVRFSKVNIFAPANRDYEFRVQTLCNDGSESEFTAWMPFTTVASGIIAAQSRNEPEFIADITIEAPANIELEIMPNPVHTLLNLSYPQLSQNATLLLYHISGKKIKEVQLPTQSNFIQVDIAEFSNGLYLLRIEDENGLLGNAKFIKK